MGRLGDFLQVVYSAKPSFSTIRASIRNWADRSLAEQAREARYVHGRRKAVVERPDSRAEWLMRIAFAPGDRARMESTSESGKGPRSSLVVVNGSRWWRRDDQGHVEIPGDRDRPPPLISIERHFSHQQLRAFFEALSLEEIGPVDTAGCSCIRIRATRNSEGQIWPHWLPSGADEYEFHGDPERGVLLSIIGFHRGKPFKGHEVVDVRFDDVILDETFTYVPAPSEQVRRSVPVVEQLSLKEAVERAKFTVLVPTKLGEFASGHKQVFFHPSQLHDPRAKLNLSYHNFGRGDLQVIQLDQAASADPEWEELEWQNITHQGRELRVSDPETERGYRLIAFEQAGTHVLVSSPLPLATLLDFAVSLEPVSG